MIRVGLAGILLTIFSLFLIEVVSYSTGITEAPNPLLERTQIYIIVMAIFSVALIAIDFFLINKKNKK